MLRITLLTILVCVAGLQEAWAQSRSENAAVWLNWRSTAGNDEAVARDIEHLYLALYNTGNLAVRKVENPDGIFVERLIRKEGIFYGAYFPRSLDSLLCDLNRQVCSRRRVPAPQGKLLDVTSHVGGYSVSESVWTLVPGVAIMLPDYNFESFTTIQKVPVLPEWSSQDYKPAGDVNCSIWGADCAELVRGLNPPLLKGPKENELSAVLPVGGIETQIQLKADPLTKHMTTLDRIGAKQQPGIVTFAAPDLLDFDSKWLDTLSKTSRTDVTIKAVDDNLVTIGSGTKFGASGEPLFNQQVDLLRLIRHPFSTNDDLDDVYKHPVGVLLIDEAFDPEHCDLPPDGAGAPAPCTDIAPAPDPLNDHAAHIFGIISAPMNGRGIVGLNPSALVNIGAVNTAFTATEDIDEVNNLLFQAVRKHVRIANLSWGFDREFGDNSFEAGIAGVQKTILIVAAAGNGNRSLTDDCRVFPACMHKLDNVITVIGLDRNESEPALWKENELQGSNSSRFFHIGAIADHVLSTVRDNKLGLMSGTSQAAPQVTATASLIYSAAEQIYADLIAETGEQLAPKIVKDRLIYTADIFPGLQSKVQSGRLNVKRAIDIVDTQLVLKRADGIVTLKGRLVQIPNDIITCLEPDGANKPHAWGSIRRIFYVEERQRYVIFKHEIPNDRYSKLVRVDGCNINSLSHVGKVVRDDNTEVEFAIREILDYASPMLE